MSDTYVLEHDGGDYFSIIIDERPLVDDDGEIMYFDFAASAEKFLHDLMLK